MSPIRTGTLADLGEFGLLRELRSVFDGELRSVLDDAAHVIVGPGDDAAVVSVADGRAVVSIDLLIEGRHFRRDWSSAADVGAKAIAANLSDINAMGGRGSALVVGLGAPPDLDVAWVLELAVAMQEEAASIGARIVGGDVSGADEIILAITVLGTCPDRVITRSGAQPGDQVAVAGRLGWAGAGFAVLARGFRSPRAVVEAHRRPHPPYDAGPQAARLDATAMIDVSDGLLADLNHVAMASDVLIDLDSRAFEVDEPLQAVGAAIGTEPLSFVLTGGDDYALAATFPPSVVLPDPWRVVGRVSGASANTSQVSVTVDGQPYESEPGHRHFA
jgi:thiamine-monophosphate kinase